MTRTGFWKWFCNKRGQSEMIGLVIIVIMITLGLLFLAKFALQEEPAKKVFTRKGLAYSTMSAIMKTELACYGPSDVDPKFMEVQNDLLEKCAEEIGAGGGTYSDSIATCSLEGQNLNYCEFLENRMTYLLNETLGAWFKNYQYSSVLLVGTNEYELVEIDSGGCGLSSDRDSSGLFPIYVKNVGLIESVLYICD